MTISDLASRSVIGVSLAFAIMIIILVFNVLNFINTRDNKHTTSRLHDFFLPGIGVGDTYRFQAAGLPNGGDLIAFLKANITNFNAAHVGKVIQRGSWSLTLLYESSATSGATLNVNYPSGKQQLTFQTNATSLSGIGFGTFDNRAGQLSSMNVTLWELGTNVPDTDFAYIFEYNDSGL